MKETAEQAPALKGHDGDADWSDLPLTESDQHLLRVLREGPQAGDFPPLLPSYALRKRLATQSGAVAQRLLFWAERAETAMAMALLAVAVAVAPNHAPARVALAWRHFEQGDGAEACRQAAQAYQHAPRDAAAAYGFFLLDTVNAAAAAAVLLPAFAANPEDPLLNWYVGLLYQRQGDLPEAALRLRAACQSDASLADAAFALAWVLHDLGEMAEAVFWSDHALAAGATGDRLIQAAWFALCRRAYGVAEEYYCRAARFFELADARCERLYLHWAEALQALGRGEEARRRLSDAIAHHSGAARLWFRLGCIAQEAGDWRTADYAFEKAHTLEPGFAEAFFQRALGLYGRSMDEGVAWLLEQGLYWAPGTLGARALLAEVRRELGHSEAAEELGPEPLFLSDAETAALSEKDRIRAAAAQAFALWQQSGRPLRLPIGSAFDLSSIPDISVVIVTFNQVGLTLQALTALAAQTGPRFETILVDNGSSDGTSALLARLQGAVIIRNAENLGFLRAANQGAARARGRHILFLNSDAQVQLGALAAALARMESAPSIGIVGAQIILTDGRLQEAGNSLYREGAAAGYGRGDAPDAPQYQFPRDVDYCSGAFLLVRRPLWEMLGGFDPIFAPAYYEDTDFCLRVWRAGFRVVYEPRARVIHVEGGSALNAAEPIELMEKNRSLFVARHPELASRPAAPPTPPNMAIRKPVNAPN